MNFYCIVNKEKDNLTRNYFLNASKNHDISYIEIDEDEFDITKILEPGLLYRNSTSKKARSVEMEILTSQKMTTLHRNEKNAFSIANDISWQKKNGLKMPRSISHMPSSKSLLQKYVEEIGGFPVILKASGLSHGAGIMKIDSIDSLSNIIDFIHSQGETSLTIREFIKASSHARIIVLNDKVIDSIEYIAPDNDYRTNIGIPEVVQKKFPKEFENLAIEAVKVQGEFFGGVDLISNEKGEALLLEVNHPCFFARSQEVTEVDIAGKIIEFLIKVHKTR